MRAKGKNICLSVSSQRDKREQGKLKAGEKRREGWPHSCPIFSHCGRNSKKDRRSRMYLAGKDLQKRSSHTGGSTTFLGQEGRGRGALNQSKATNLPRPFGNPSLVNEKRGSPTRKGTATQPPLPHQSVPFFLLLLLEGATRGSNDKKGRILIKKRKQSTRLPQE